MRSTLAQQKSVLDNIVLNKLKYDLNSHPFETCDWLNVLLGQFIATTRNDPSLLPQIAEKLDHLFNKDQGISGFIGPISITEFSIGEDFPEFRNARVSQHDGNLQIEVDFSFNELIAISIETFALINWPKPSIASLPISLAFSLLKFSGTISIEFETDQSSADSFVSFSVLPDFVLDFGVSSLLGHRTKIKDLPKLTSLISNGLQSLFIKELVYPQKKKVKLPNLANLFTVAIPNDNHSHSPSKAADKNVNTDNSLRNNKENILESTPIEVPAMQSRHKSDHTVLSHKRSISSINEHLITKKQSLGSLHDASIVRKRSNSSVHESPQKKGHEALARKQVSGFTFASSLDKEKIPDSRNSSLVGDPLSLHIDSKNKS